ncbi:MAG: tetratricopeptide repeat protein [Nitriliruptor sp.]|uniref:tetratricopeptide repeat protein n=1 Tax=Nitriliruptor sp. TaxID=2448056 RepID=UPI00349FF436
MHVPIDPQSLRAAADAILEQHEAGLLTAALAACDALLARAVDLTDPVVRESAFTAWFERSAILAELGDLDAAADAALTACDSLPFDEQDPDQIHELAMLLLHAGTCQDAAGDALGAVATYDQLIAELGTATDPVTREQVIRGRVNRGATLLSLGRHLETLDAATALAHELDSALPGEAEQLGMAQRVRAAALRGLDRAEEAVVALAEAETLAAVAEVGARSQAAAAQGERARLLAELGRVDEAIDVLERVVSRFGDDPEIAQAVAELRSVEAELLDAAGDHDRAASLRAAAHA